MATRRAAPRAAPAVERRSAAGALVSRMADSFQQIVVAALLGIGAQGWYLTQSMTKLSTNYDNIERTVSELKTKLELQGETKVTRADFDTYRSQMYERMRGVEEAAKVNQSAALELSRHDSEFARDLAEMATRINDRSKR